MTNTYTYTARSSDDPQKVITFTLREEYLEVNLTGMLDNIGEVVSEEDSQTAVKDFLSTQTGSAIYKAVERISGPIHVNDVDPYYEEGQFKLRFWKRIAGLRFAPITLTMGNVDNPEATGQFIDTLMTRQDEAESPGPFAGPLDYWATWIGLLLGLIVLIK